jgi:hypothetical protein
MPRAQQTAARSRLRSGQRRLPQHRMAPDEFRSSDDLEAEWSVLMGPAKQQQQQHGHLAQQHFGEQR